MSDETKPYDTFVPAGANQPFVNMVHEDLTAAAQAIDGDAKDVIAEVPEGAIEHYIQRGWKVVERVIAEAEGEIAKAEGAVDAKLGGTTPTGGLAPDASKPVVPVTSAPTPAGSQTNAPGGATSS